MTFRCASLPTRDTERPGLIAGRKPALKRSGSMNSWPSVMEITFVGMYAEMSFACVSMMGSAVSDPPPSSSFSFTARSSSREWR